MQNTAADTRVTADRRYSISTNHGTRTTADI